MLRAGWFDAPLRKTPGRLTTKGDGLGTGQGIEARFLSGLRNDRSGAWVLGLSGSTRPLEDSCPAHHERDGAGDVRKFRGAGGG